MIGRGNDKYKRFDLGIKAMKFIIHEVPQSEMKIISSKNAVILHIIFIIIIIRFYSSLLFLQNLIKYLNLKSYVKFIGYSSTIKMEIYRAFQI